MLVNMPSSCAHIYCRNSTTNYKTDGRKISFHKFPAVASTRQLWIENLKRDGFKPSSKSVICSEHFNKVCFVPKSGNKRHRLRYGAVPTLFARNWNAKVVEEVEMEEDKSSEGEPESWSGWHSWPDKKGSTKANGQDNASKGLEEFEELMEEDQDDEEDLSNEREEMDESLKDALEGMTGVASRSSGEVVQPEATTENGFTHDVPDVLQKSDKIVQPEAAAGNGTTRNVLDGFPKSDKIVRLEAAAGNGTTRNALAVLQKSEKISLDKVTMDASLSAVKVGNQKMVSMTFQDVLNSLITPQESASSASHKKSSESTPTCTSSKVTGHQDQGQQNTDKQDTSSQSTGWMAVGGKETSQSSKATQQSLITPLKLPKKRERETTKDKDTKEKGSKTNRKGKKMVISIYRQNTMIRVISSKDLPYLCGDCGSAFTHASVLKEHVETKHNYSEPPDIKTNEVMSEVVTHREFLKENLKTKAQVKELKKKYPKTKYGAVNKGSEPRWFEKVEKSNSSIPEADSEIDDPMGDDASNLGDDQGMVEGGDSPPAKKKRKRKKPFTKKKKERCHRCPVVYTSLAHRKQHLIEVHHEFQTREEAYIMLKIKAGRSAEEVFKCIYCETYFISTEDAEGHLNKHCGLDGTKCETCKEGIKLWNEGRNMELEELHRRYVGLKEQNEDKDGASKETEGAERRDDEGATVNSEGKLNAEDLIRQSLERVKRLSNKHYVIAKCFECNEEFFLRNHLQSHYRQHEKFTCKECSEECRTMTDYQNHLEEIHKVGLCPCLYCPKKFPNLGKLNYHMLGHLGMFQCILCGLTLMSKQSLESHIQGAVNDPDHKLRRVGEERVTYSSSNPFFARSEYGTRVHRRANWRLPKEKCISCKFCDRRFGYAHGLRRHMRSLHPKEEVPMPDGNGFCCEHCGIVLATKQSFKMHLQTHDKSTHHCPKPGCKAMYSNKYSLRHHLKTHGQGPTTNPMGRYFRCDLCRGTFKTQQYLDVHMKTHSGFKPYTCRYCEKNFRNVTHMVYHEKRVHTGELDHVCEVCSKGFADPSTLKVHVRIHSAERPFVCKFCSKSFPTELYLRAHVRIHTKPFKCAQCGEGFSQQGARRNHLLKVHGIDMPINRSKARYPIPHEAEPSDEERAEMAEEMELQDIDVSETLVITEDKEMISKILAGMY